MARLHVPATLGDQRQVVVRELHVRLLGDRRTDLLLRFRQVPALEGDHTERVARRRDARVVGKRLLERGLRLVQLIEVDEQLPQLVAHPGVLRVLLQVPLVSEDRRVVVPERAVGRPPD